MASSQHDKAGADAAHMVENLTSVGRADTVYRDIYLERARAILSQTLPYDDYRQLIQKRAFLLDLPKKIQASMQREEWEEVKSLSRQGSLAQKRLETSSTVIDIAGDTYDIHDILLDPFSPGLRGMLESRAHELPALREKTLQKLEDLEQEDPPFKKFYALRHAAFEALSPADSQVEHSAKALDPGQLQQKALEALESKNLDLLEQVADSMLKQRDGGKSGSPGEVSAGDAQQKTRDRLVTFTDGTFTASKKLGLVAARVEALTEYAPLCQFAMHPTFGDESTKPWGPDRITDLPFPPNIPEALKKRARLYMLHPFINSGGGRYLPDLVAEDFLVEDFPDPPDTKDLATSELLSALGLKRRNRLSRLQIEQALLENGPRILREALSLDPIVFRLVCIPPDLHFRLGQSRGWGNQALWTHFDGYKVLRDGKLSALAGGDARFGGIYDMVSIGREYESDRVIARFAVVLRDRMVTW